MKPAGSTYRSYMLRLRYFDDKGQRSWRISLEEPGSGKQVHFQEPDELITFLTEVMALNSKPDRSEPL